MQVHVKEHKRMCLLLISHHFHGMFGYVTNFKQLEDAIVLVNQSGSRKMLPPLPGARDKFAPFAKILVSLRYAILRTES